MSSERFHGGRFLQHDEGETTMTTTVLVVDPDPPDSANYEALMRGQGYQVVIARSGQVALDLCPNLRPDLVLLTDFLPDIHGSEVCRRLKADPRNHLTPIVLLTAASDVSELSRGFDAGADDYWTQSFSPREMIDRARFLLQLKTYVENQAASIIFSLAQTVEARDPYDTGHSERVSNNAVRFGKSLCLPEEDLETLRIGGLVHDIGKIGIPHDILFKPGPLDFEETRIVRQHPVWGEKLCAPLKALRQALPIIRHHHERMDGSGYPDGLQGQQIPLTARIVKIVDACDALTSDRSYRKKLSLPQALVVLYQEADQGWLDQSLVSHFATLAVGSEISLTLGHRRRIRLPEMREWSGNNMTDLRSRKLM
jgi:putative two-component system response regulator